MCSSVPFCINVPEKLPDAGTASICSSSGLIGIGQIVLSGTSLKNTKPNVIVTTRLSISIP